MTRGVQLSLIGALVVLTLAGCGRSWFETREPWRREAEEQCLKSGAVREGPAIAMLKPIQGPGACGADFPLKVAALGEGPAMSYTDEPLRPPGSVPLGLPDYASRPVPTVSEISANSPPFYRANPASSRLAPTSLDTYSPPPPPPDDADDEGRRSQAVPLYRSPEGAAPAPLGRGEPQAAIVTTAAVTPPATLACPIVSALDRWITESVQPAAQRWFNQPVIEIRQISAYSCRGMNGRPGAHISEHAFGNALDIAAFTLGDGRQVTVKDGWRGLPEEQGFLRDVQAAACEQFTTVLAPGSNAYHYDHIHVDLMRRASGRRICEPFAMSGEEAAARARTRYARPGMRGVTGTISMRAKPAGRAAREIVDDEFEAD